MPCMPIRLPFVTIEFLAIIALLDSHLEAVRAKDCAATEPLPRSTDARARRGNLSRSGSARGPCSQNAPGNARRDRGSMQGSHRLVDLHAGGSGSATCVLAAGFFVTNHHVASIAGLGHNVELVVRPGQNNQRVPRLGSSSSTKSMTSPS